jgi:hypothetical protein
MPEPGSNTVLLHETMCESITDGIDPGEPGAPPDSPVPLLLSAATAAGQHPVDFLLSDFVALPATAREAARRTCGGPTRRGL